MTVPFNSVCPPAWAVTTALEPCTRNGYFAVLENMGFVFCSAENHGKDHGFCFVSWPLLIQRCSYNKKRIYEMSIGSTDVLYMEVVYQQRDHRITE